MAPEEQERVVVVDLMGAVPSWTHEEHDDDERGDERVDVRGDVASSASAGAMICWTTRLPALVGLLMNDLR